MTFIKSLENNCESLQIVAGFRYLKSKCQANMLRHEPCNLYFIYILKNFCSFYSSKNLKTLSLQYARLSRYLITHAMIYSEHSRTCGNSTNWRQIAWNNVFLKTNPSWSNLRLTNSVTEKFGILYTYSLMTQFQSRVVTLQ